MHCIYFLQVTILVGQSVIIGYLSDYFSVPNPTVEEDRDAYLLAFGMLSLQQVPLIICDADTM